jgi:hypothetical protein
MANGQNEPIEFTRGDAERLVTIENGQTELGDSFDAFQQEWRAYRAQHGESHQCLSRETNANTRFRLRTKRVFLWIITPGAGLGIAWEIVRGFIH